MTKAQAFFHIQSNVWNINSLLILSLIVKVSRVMSSISKYWWTSLLLKQNRVPQWNLSALIQMLYNVYILNVNMKQNYNTLIYLKYLFFDSVFVVKITMKTIHNNLIITITGKIYNTCTYTTNNGTLKVSMKSNYNDNKESLTDFT
jgi:hypothetical protein